MEPVTEEKSYLKPATYDLLQKIVQIVLPALATLYYGLATQWDLRDPEKVVASITLITTFLGVLLQLSKSRYAKSDAKFVGETYLVPTDDGWKRVFNVTSDEIDPAKKELMFKAVDSQAP